MLGECIYNVLYLILGFPCGSGGKESACNAGDLGSVSGLGRSPRGEHGNPVVFLPGESPKTDEPGGLQSTGRKEQDGTERLAQRTWCVAV